ncbi:MAG: serine hydrolase [Acidiferrobacterales bacterium]|nr:serine hydrolase [Acidiferrobacterales bacterium]
MAFLGLLGVAAIVDQVDAENYPIGDKDTMWADPYLIGSLRHVGEIFPSRPVLHLGPPSELERGVEIAELDYQLRGKTHSLEDYFEQTRTTGFIVLKDGRIVFERYRLGADERSLFMSMSVSKSFVSTLVGFAIGDGLIGSVNDPISDYLPELAGTGYDSVPIKAVLQMSSGVDFFEDYNQVGSDFNRMWRESVHDNKTPITAFVRKVKRQREPYTRFYYSAADTIALGWLLKRVTGKTLSGYLSEKMWGPLGMESGANWVVDGPAEDASELAFCCLSATLRDYSRFGLLMLQDGKWQGQQLLPPGWVREASRPDRPQVQPGQIDAGDLGYQYQWWTFPGDDGAYMARGVNGQFIYVNPADKLVIVVTSVWYYWWSADLAEHTYAVFDAFAYVLHQ